MQYRSGPRSQLSVCCSYVCSIDIKSTYLTVHASSKPKPVQMWVQSEPSVSIYKLYMLCLPIALHVHAHAWSHKQITSHVVSVKDNLIGSKPPTGSHPSTATIYLDSLSPGFKHGPCTSFCEQRFANLLSITRGDSSSAFDKHAHTCWNQNVAWSSRRVPRAGEYTAATSADSSVRFPAFPMIHAYI